MTKYSMPTSYYAEDPTERKLREFNRRRGFGDAVSESEIMARRARLQRLREENEYGR